MKKILIGLTVLLLFSVVGCSNSKWTFSNKDYDLLLSEAHEMKNNYDMYVEKENRGLDYSEELEKNVEISDRALEDTQNIRKKYEDKLTEEETTMLAELCLTYRYLRYNLDSQDKTTIKRIEKLKEQILKLEEE